MLNGAALDNTSMFNYHNAYLLRALPSYRNIIDHRTDNDDAGGWAGSDMPKSLRQLLRIYRQCRALLVRASCFAVSCRVSVV